MPPERSRRVARARVTLSPSMENRQTTKKKSSNKSTKRRSGKRNASTERNKKRAMMSDVRDASASDGGFFNMSAYGDGCVVI